MHKHFPRITILLTTLLVCTPSHAATLGLRDYKQATSNFQACSDSLAKHGLTLSFQPSPTIPERHLHIPTWNTNTSGVNLTISKAKNQTLQTLALRVTETRPEVTLCDVRVEDVNFDGYLDIAVVTDFGAKWAGFKYWLYDPKTGRYVSNHLTRQLSKLWAGEILFDRPTRTVSVRNYVFDGVVHEVFKVNHNHLILLQQERINANEDPAKSTVTLLKRIHGKMQVVEVKPLEYK